MYNYYLIIILFKFDIKIYTIKHFFIMQKWKDRHEWTDMDDNGHKWTR